MIGQLNVNTKAGNEITRIAAQQDVLSIVEIGTWNGCGTTQCVLLGIKFRPEVTFYSLECNSEQYALAISNVKQTDNIKLLLGKIVEDAELYTSNLSPEEQTYLKDDLDAFAQVPNVLAQLPEAIDFLILDGGEFSTIAELAKLKSRCKYIFLDDTIMRKNKKNRASLIADSAFELVIEDSTDRHGWSLFKRT